MPPWWETNAHRRRANGIHGTTAVIHAPEARGTRLRITSVSGGWKSPCKLPGLGYRGRVCLPRRLDQNRPERRTLLPALDPEARSFVKIFPTWDFTVASETKRRSAISALENPFGHLNEHLALTFSQLTSSSAAWLSWPDTPAGNSCAKVSSSLRVTRGDTTASPRATTWIAETNPAGGTSFSGRKPLPRQPEARRRHTRRGRTL